LLLGIVLVGVVAFLIQNTIGQVALAGGLALIVWYRWFYAPRRRRFHVKTLGELLALTPRRFEEAVGEVLRDNGFRDVKHVGGSGDLSADLMCRDDRGHLVAVQCKRFSPGIRIGSRDIQEFIGMIAVHHRARRGLFITTTEFTQPAVDLARQHGLTLIDGQKLTRMIERRERNGT
jgi:restriction endonuclease Mrr